MSRRAESGEPIAEEKENRKLATEYSSLGDALLDYFDDNGIPRNKQEAQEEKQAEEKRKPVPRGKARKKCEVCGAFFLVNEIPPGSSDYDKISWREQHRMCPECAQLGNISMGDKDRSWSPRDFKPRDGDDLPGDVIRI